MKRPFGVTFSAIILLMGVALQLLMAIGMVLAGAAGPLRNAGGVAGAPRHAPMPGWTPLMMYFMSAISVGLATWGIVTAIGLFRLRGWARYSVLVIGGCVAFFGLASMAVTFAMLLVPFTPPPGSDAYALDPNQVQTVRAMTKVMFVVLAFIYGIVCAIGVSWLVYFNRKTVRAAFGRQITEAIAGANPSVTVMDVPDRRPLLVAVIAVLNMIGALFVLLSVFLPIPGIAFGFILHGWQKTVVYLVYACLAGLMGLGLWRMKEWGRRLTLAMLALGVVQSAFYAFRPSLLVRYSTEINQLIIPTQTPLPAHFQSTLYSASFGVSVLLCIAIAAILIYYRPEFRRKISPSGDVAAV